MSSLSTDYLDSSAQHSLRFNRRINLQRKIILAVKQPTFHPTLLTLSLFLSLPSQYSKMSQLTASDPSVCGEYIVRYLNLSLKRFAFITKPIARMRCKTKEKSTQTLFSQWPAC